MKPSLLCLCSGLLFSSMAAADCDAPALLEKLRSTELAFQLEKFPPAFRHAVEDGAVELRMTMQASAAVACTVVLEETLPAADVKQAAEIIEAQPARRIMLLSQGYALPEASQLRAQFSVDPATLSVPHADTLQLAELGKLRATVEMIYATLSQARAEVSQEGRNAQPWKDAVRQRVIEACQARSPGSDTAKSCRCHADGLQARLGERQLDHVAYVKENPYAYATGALKGYEVLEDEVRRACRQAN